MQAQAAQMRQFEEVLIHELKMQEEERVILRHTADTVKQVRVQYSFLFCLYAWLLHYVASNYVPSERDMVCGYFSRLCLAV